MDNLESKHQNKKQENMLRCEPEPSDYIWLMGASSVIRRAGNLFHGESFIFGVNHQLRLVMLVTTQKMTLTHSC